MQEVRKPQSNKLLILGFLLASITLGAQNKTTELVNTMDIVLPLPKTDTSLLIQSTNLNIVKKFNANSLPIFCKFEHLLGKNSNYNIKMRLGDVQYVDRLEGKGLSHPR